MSGSRKKRKIICSCLESRCTFDTLHSRGAVNHFGLAYHQLFFFKLIPFSFDIEEIFLVVERLLCLYCVNTVSKVCKPLHYWRNTGMGPSRASWPYEANKFAITFFKSHLTNFVYSAPASQILCFFAGGHNFFPQIVLCLIFTDVVSPAGLY